MAKQGLSQKVVRRRLKKVFGGKGFFCWSRKKLQSLMWYKCKIAYQCYKQHFSKKQRHSPMHLRSPSRLILPALLLLLLSPVFAQFSADNPSGQGSQNQGQSFSAQPLIKENIPPYSPIPPSNTNNINILPSNVRVVGGGPGPSYASRNIAVRYRINVQPPKMATDNAVTATTNTNNLALNFGSFQNNQISYEQRRANQWRKFVEQDPLLDSDYAREEHDYYQQKYVIDSYPELPFCIVVPTYNNANGQRYLRNMRSVLMQNYKKYHLVVIDDASTDETGKLIADYLASQTILPSERYEVLRNAQQIKALHNLRKAAKEYCRPEDIFLIVDGDDELLGKQVLKLFSAIFQRDGAWFVYTNFIMGTYGQIGYSRPFPTRTIERNAYRTFPFVTSHLRAFYTQLFLNIKEADLRGEDGEYLRAANDVAICIPILEQAHQRVKYIPEITYYYNNTGQNNHILRAMEQRNNDRRTRRKNSYSPLDTLFQ